MNDEINRTNQLLEAILSVLREQLSELKAIREELKATRRLDLERLSTALPDTAIENAQDLMKRLAEDIRRPHRRN